MSTLNCSGELEFHEKTIYKHGLSFAYRKNFSYGQTISDAMQELSDVDGFERTTEKWISQLLCMGVVSSQQFDWTYFSGLLIIIGFALLFGICVNAVEYIYFYLKRVKTDNSEAETEGI